MGEETRWEKVVHQLQVTFGFGTKPSAPMMLRVKSKAAHVELHAARQAPVAPRTGISPLSHPAPPRDGSLPCENPADAGVGVQWRTPLAPSYAVPAAAQGEPTPGKAVEKATVPFNDPSLP